MKTSRLGTTLAALAVVGASGADVAMAADAAVRDVSVRVTVQSGIPPRVAADATAIVERIYGAFGLTLRLRNNDAPGADAVSRTLVLQMGATKQFPAARRPSSHVLGATPRLGLAPGMVAYVFYDGVRKMADLYSVPVATVLGYAMAHELGHLLLPPAAHGVSGVMVAEWNVEDAARMRNGTLAMGVREAGLIREYLQSGGQPLL